MKFKFKGQKVIIEMTIKQMNSLEAIFESFTDQVSEASPAYGDCVKNTNRWRRAKMKALS